MLDNIRTKAKEKNKYINKKKLYLLLLYYILSIYKYTYIYDVYGKVSMYIEMNGQRDTK